MALNVERYLRASQREIQHHIATAIPSERQDASESAGLVAEILGRLATDLVVLPALAAPRIPAYRALIDKLDAKLQEAGHHRSGVRDADSAVGLPPLQELDALRGAVAYAIDDLEKLPNDALRRQLLDEISALDCEWRTACVRARDARTSTDDAEDDNSGTEHAAGKESAEVTAGALTTYLRRKFPDRSGLAVTAVRPLAGGRSKDTYIVTLEGAESWPEHVVMRQDAARHALATLVRDEYRVLEGIGPYGVKAPKTLMLEPEASELGNPFYLMEMLPGEPSGTYYVGLFETDPDMRRQFVLDVAEALGKLHAIDPSKVLAGAPSSHGEHLLKEIRHYKDQWRASAVEQSPMIAAAFVWLEAEVKMGIGEAAILHGDVAVHNMLSRDGHLTALLDWELFSVGDPAADLAYVRPVIESAVPWSEFMDAYVAAGGDPIDERRLKMFAVWGFIRNASIVAGAADAFQRDPTARFEVGYMAAAVAFLEEQLVPLLDPGIQKEQPVAA